MPIEISSLSQAKRRKRSFDAVLTIEDPGTHPHKSLRFQKTPHPAHLVLRFEDADIDDGRVWVAKDADILSALDFARSVGDAGSLLVHCEHGIGRSAAISLAILADRLGPAREREAVSELFRLRPEAVPNLPAVSAADRVLGRGGSLAGALLDAEAALPEMAEKRRRRADLFEKHRYRFVDLPTPPARKRIDPER